MTPFKGAAVLVGFTIGYKVWVFVVMATSGFTMLAAVALLNYEHREYIKEHWRRTGPGNAGSLAERNALAAAIKAFAAHPADPEKVQRQKWLLRNAEIITPAIDENDIDAEYCFWSTSPHVLADDVVCNVFTAFRASPERPYYFRLTR